MHKIRNPHRTYEKTPKILDAVTELGADFLSDFTKVVSWSIDNCRVDENNREKSGLPPEPYSLETLKWTEEDHAKPKLVEHALAMVENEINSWQWIYENICDDDSKLILLTVLAYRAIGWRYVKMPLDNSAFWDCMRILSEAESNAEAHDTIQTEGLGILLSKMDLSAIGYDVNVYSDAFGTFNEFVYSQYVYRGRNNVIGPREGDVVMDCGACFGGTSMFFADQVGEKGKVFSFEFLPENVEVFNRNRQQNARLSSRVELIKAPVWSTSNKTMSIEGNGPATQVHLKSIPGAQEIHSVSIDDVVSEKKLTRLDFIKMDIEGAEMEALRGAKKSIKRFRPVLAICVYHKLMDFYELPQFVASLNLGYRFYFQHSTVHGDETVVFAIPRERTDTLVQASGKNQLISGLLGKLLPKASSKTSSCN